MAQSLSLNTDVPGKGITVIRIDDNNNGEQAL